jgi:hypothetical protein
MPSSTSPFALSWKWTLLAALLLAGIVLALVLGPGTHPLVIPEGMAP